MTIDASHAEALWHALATAVADPRVDTWWIYSDAHKIQIKALRRFRADARRWVQVVHAWSYEQLADAPAWLFIRDLDRMAHEAHRAGELHDPR